jgi:hypothetical protein
MHRVFPRLERDSPVFSKTAARKSLDAAAAGQDAEILKTRFRQALAGRSLSASDRKELNARIDRRLVLTESQLSADSVRAEKLEARGLDYVGKASIARQAISTRSLLEVVWSSPEEGGREQRVLAFPLNLEKSGGESILVVEDSRTPRDTQPASRGGENDPPQRVPGGAARTPGNTVRIPGNTIRIPLGKISLLRRIKKSIFEE